MAARLVFLIQLLHTEWRSYVQKLSVVVYCLLAMFFMPPSPHGVCCQLCGGAGCAINQRADCVLLSQPPMCCRSGSV